MAFKGITWAGNIYQKFETMCLEVEEVMYEDTVKYMENQVQKVGVSVKKFYSEVMQDLLPPSCVDPVKSSGNLSFNPYPDTDVKKPKLSVFDGQGEDKKKDTEDEVVSDRTTGKDSCNSVHNVLVENTASKSCSTKSRMGIHRRAIGIKRISQNIRPAKVSSAVTSSSGHGSNKLVCDVNKASELDVVVRLPREAINNNALTSDASVKSSSDKEISAECVHPKKDDSNCTLPSSDIILTADESQSQKKDIYVCTSSVRPETENFDSTSPVSHEFYSAKSVGQMIDNLECTSRNSYEIENAESARQNKYVSCCTSSSGSLPSEGTSTSRDSFSKSGSSIISNNALEVESVAEGIMTPNEGSSMKDGSFHLLSSSSDICDVKFADDFNMEVIENDEIDEPRLETFDHVERSKLEETCVLVEGDELHLVQGQGIKKNKSYKKKIREALSLKLRSPRKQDQHVPESKDPGEKYNSSAVMKMDSDKRKLQGHESLESDWELL